MKVIPKTTAGAGGIGHAEAASSSKVGASKADKKSSSAESILSSKSDSSAKVDFSTRAKEIKKAKDIATSTPDIDEAKVAKYQSMIDKGEYKVDAKAVADRMVDEHLSTFGADNE